MPGTCAAGVGILLASPDAWDDVSSLFIKLLESCYMYSAVLTSRQIAMLPILRPKPILQQTTAGSSLPMRMHIEIMQTLLVDVREQPRPKRDDVEFLPLPPVPLRKGEIAQQVDDGLPVEGFRVGRGGVVVAHGLEDGQRLGEQLVGRVETFEVEQMRLIVVGGDDEPVVGRGGDVSVVAELELQRSGGVEFEEVKVFRDEAVVEERSWAPESDFGWTRFCRDYAPDGNHFGLPGKQTALG